MFCNKPSAFELVSPASQLVAFALKPPFPQVERSVFRGIKIPLVFYLKRLTEVS